MAQQDLTPQLRTRLNRVERAVGIFVTLATLLLLLGFGYYIYHVAKRKGWFRTKIAYQTGINNAAGLAVGNPVKLMGFSVGEITDIIPNEPYAGYGVTVVFRIQSPNYGYIWTDSKVRVAPADFLGNRYLEVLKGRDGIPTVLETNKTAIGLLNPAALATRFDEKFPALLTAAEKENPDFTEHALRAEATNEVQKALHAEVRSSPELFYIPLSKTNSPYWLEPLESPAVTERLEALLNTAEGALPNILNLTNKLTAILTNTDATIDELKGIVNGMRPVVTNLSVITSNLRNPQGSLGEWILPKELNKQLNDTLSTAEATLRTADKTLGHTDTNLTSLVANINLSLENLAQLTGNLNAQVQTNSNIVREMSDAIVHTDELVQGLKRHWLLRSAFKTNKVQKAQPPPSGKR